MSGVLAEWTESACGRIVIAGAGSVGCYTGGTLALAGRAITLLLRPAMANAISAKGFSVRDLQRAERHISPAQIELATDPEVAFKNATVIIVTVKCGATAEMADLIARHAPANAIVASFQNGVDNAGIMRERLGSDRTVVSGMVPFNVMQLPRTGEPALFLRATSGSIQIDAGHGRLRGLLNVAGLPVLENPDMTGVLWSKLVINLNNAINALAGIPLRNELCDRRWRLILARQMDEALASLKAEGIETSQIEGVRPHLMAKALRLPTWLFRIVASQALAIDPQARSSMWDDLERRHPTEIDHLQGAILRLSQKHGIATLLTQRITELIRQSEKAGLGSPGLDPFDVGIGDHKRPQP